MGLQARAVTAAFGVTIAGSAAIADGPPQYRLFLLGRPDTSIEDRATAINGLGDIAGRSNVFIEAEQDGVGVIRTRPVLWRRGDRQASEVLSLAPNTHQSWTVGIDDAARVYSHTNENTGSHSMFDGQQHDFYLEPGEPQLGGFPRDVSDVSENGLVAGTALQNAVPPGAPWGNYQPATLWNPDGSRLVRIGTLGGQSARAFGVNNKGWACGVSQEGESLTAPSFPFFYIDGELSRAPEPAGSPSASGQALAINRDGVVVGRMGSGSNSRAAVWNALTGEAQLLPMFANDTSPIDVANDISDNRLIVGRSSTTNDFGKGVVWLDGQVFDIETLIVESDAPMLNTGSGPELSAVNGYDEIVGYANFDVDGVPLFESRFAFVLLPACPADLNGDRTLSFTDVVQYVGEFASERQRADVNRDGVHDFTDVIAYLQRFAEGCG